jgi:stage III sporulation protein AD
MEILVYVGFAVAIAVASMLLRQIKPELATLLVVVASLAVFASLLSKMGAIFRVVEDLAQRASIGNLHMKTLLKIMGVAYVAEYGSQICRDAGEGSLGLKIELAGKLIILTLSIPLLLVILETILRLVP